MLTADMNVRLKRSLKEKGENSSDCMRCASCTDMNVTFKRPLKKRMAWKGWSK